MLATILICCLGTLSLLTDVSADEWPQWRGMNRDGRSSDVGLLKSWPQDGPPLLWQNDKIGIGFSSTVVVDQMVYTTGDIGDDLVITALDMDGQTKWQKGHGPGWTGRRSPGSLGTPTVDGGRLYLLSAHGLLKCYDASTGEEFWQADIVETFGGTQPGWGYSESPLVYDDKVIVTPGGQNCILALNKMTGEPVWTSTGVTDPAAYSSCIAVEFEGHPIIVQMVEKGMVAVDAMTGEFLWRNDRAVNGAACATPVYADGYCFGATGYGNGGACVRLSVENGKVVATQVWDTKEMICHHGGFVVHEGYIYGNHEKGWSCLELTTGKQKWYAEGVGKGSICFADGMLYTFSEGGGRVGLVHAKPDAFEQVGEFRVEGRGNSWAYPVVASGKLFLRYHETLYCYDVKEN